MVVAATELLRTPILEVSSTVLWRIQHLLFLGTFLLEANRFWDLLMNASHSFTCTSTGYSSDARWADFNALCNARASRESDSPNAANAVSSRCALARAACMASSGFDGRGTLPAGETASNDHVAAERLTNCAPLRRPLHGFRARSTKDLDPTGGHLQLTPSTAWH